MDCSAPPYQLFHARFYEPLSHPDSIRILTVFECDNEQDDIEGYISEVRLSDSRNDDEGYTALSYAWGDRKFTHEIWIGDQRLLIGANLDSALRHLRLQDGPIRLWVDAVCMNLEDLDERNHQVQQMRNIFSAACETIIWLGELDGGNTSVAAWNFLERHSPWALNDRHEHDETLPTKLDEELLSFRGELRDVEIDVLSRPWFRRQWAVQEIVVSRNLSIQCGNRRVPWDGFCKAVLLSERHHDRYGFSIRDDDKTNIVRHMHRARVEYLRHRGLDEFLPSWQLPESNGSPPGVLNIFKLLQRGRYLETADARDNIFGVLGIAEGIDTNDPRFRIDYRLSPQDLYTNFAKNIIEATGSFEILSYVALSAMGGGHRAAITTPSWIPNWDYCGPATSRSLSYRSQLTILDTLPTESEEETESRRIRVANSNIKWSQSEAEATSLGSMEVTGRILGRIGAVSHSIWLDNNYEALFKHAKDIAEDEAENFILQMAVWVRKLLFADHGINFKATVDFINKVKANSVHREQLASPKEDGPSLSEEFWEAENVETQIHRHLKQATIQSPNIPVQQHLYRRGQGTAYGSGQNLDVDVPPARMYLIDEGSIVDSRRLAICEPCTSAESAGSMQAEGQLALVPTKARKGDVVIQISGARVPFVVREHDWSEITATTDVDSLSEEGSDVDALSEEGLGDYVVVGPRSWKIVGDCVLNGFEELSEDAMDMRFRLV
ncbi:hypothetical protein N8I77_002744 [Diaporthe amygdali]|uniref:Heterokaryon incompatibility domain-containing protein n=1 Tax=Phomopsis amygdali TaxID=1214568 RepID=A0AAD9SVE4_PHOAM|nr:hypothetical protein N8I77_002744 [Diaporthe amygdali]